MRRCLENQANSLSACKIVHGLIAGWAKTQFVRIKQNCPLKKRSTTHLFSTNPLTSQFDERQRVSSSRAKKIYIQCYVKTSHFESHPTEKSSIASFTFAFASKEDATTLRNLYSTTHPNWGTAP